MNVAKGTAGLLSIEQYLRQVGRHRSSGFGKRFRRQFQDTQGTAELAMLVSPSEDEYADFCRAVTAMTDSEKQGPEKLSDDEVRAIAERAEANAGNVGLFLNGYILARKKATSNEKTR